MNVEATGGAKPEQPKILKEPLPKILDEMERHIRAAEEATRRAEKAADAATLASEEAHKAGERAAEALAKAEEALVKAVIRRLAHGEWIILLVVINLAIVFAAVLLAIAFGKAL